jgi:hypothetical protein
MVGGMGSVKLGASVARIGGGVSNEFSALRMKSPNESEPSENCISSMMVLVPPPSEPCEGEQKENCKNSTLYFPSTH